MFPPWPAVWTSYDTRPKDCHRGFRDARGRLILVGVETFGDLRTEEARQAVTLLVNERGFWSEPVRISAPGIVYFSSFAVDNAGKVWITWSEFGNNVWHVMARSWDKGALGPLEELSGGSSVSLQPVIAALPSGEIYAAWEADAGGRFEIRGRSCKAGKWGPAETLARGGDHDFRPALAADSNGILWMVWDRASASRYTVLARYRDGQKWSPEMDVFGTEARAPQIYPDGSGRIWVLAAGRLMGLDRSGQHFDLSEAAKAWKDGPDFFTIDPKGRFWLFKSFGMRASFDWMPGARNLKTQMAVLDSAGLHLLPESETGLGYAAPQVDEDGNVWAMNSIQFLRYAAPFPKAAAAPVAQSVPLPRAGAAAETARSWPRYEITIDGKPQKVYWAEMHNHLMELPLDRNVATWVDRLYLSAHRRDGLDALALTDHDWPGMTRSMYYVEQGFAKVFDTPGRFAAIAGYEWSGDSQVRARFGDRTVLFPSGYFDIPRITSEKADTSAKLHLRVKQIGGLDWPHHIGRAESPVNPKYLNPDTEPVMEMTSGHGVFETYDPKHAVRVPFHTQIIPGTAVQDALAIGKRVGMVGSSDSHSGFSGYKVGMLAIVAPSLSRESLLDAIKKRHAYAIRGGEPIFVDFRVDGHFMGDSYTSAQPPRIRIVVKGNKPIKRIELVRNNRYVLSRDYTDAAGERTLEYRDESLPPAFYYARITQDEGQWAWTSPVWVDKPAKSAQAPWWLPAVLLVGFAGLIARRGGPKR